MSAKSLMSAISGKRTGQMSRKYIKKGDKAREWGKTDFMLTATLSQIPQERQLRPALPGENPNITFEDGTAFCIPNHKPQASDDIAAAYAVAPWTARIRDPEALNNFQGEVISVLGRFNKGKSWLCNKLLLCDNVAVGDHVHTAGITGVFTESNGPGSDRMLVLDSQGLGAPVDFEVLDHYDFTTAEELHNVVDTTEVQDRFYTNLLVTMATFVLVVVCDLARSDLAFVEQVCQARKKRCDGEVVYVVHNLRSCNYAEELTARWKEICKLFAVRGQQDNPHCTDGVYFLKAENGFIPSRHIVLVNDNTEWGKAHNKRAIERLQLEIKTKGASMQQDWSSLAPVKEAIVGLTSAPKLLHNCAAIKTRIVESPAGDGSETLEFYFERENPAVEVKGTSPLEGVHGHFRGEFHPQVKIALHKFCGSESPILDFLAIQRRLRAGQSVTPEDVKVKFKKTTYFCIDMSMVGIDVHSIDARIEPHRDGNFLVVKGRSSANTSFEQRELVSDDMPQSSDGFVERYQLPTYVVLPRPEEGSDSDDDDDDEPPGPLRPQQILTEDAILRFYFRVQRQLLEAAPAASAAAAVVANVVPAVAEAAGAAAQATAFDQPPAYSTLGEIADHGKTAL